MKPLPTDPIDPGDEEDAALFRATVGKVQPLPRQNRIEPLKTPRGTMVRSPGKPRAMHDTLSDFALDTPPDEFLRNGLSRMTLRRLRRGHWPIEDSLDLHGNTSDVARKLLQEFLHEAAQRRLRCVLVIHGKGINSPGGEAVLRRLARNWLAQRPDVLAYCDASSSTGGRGAALVLLKTSSWSSCP